MSVIALVAGKGSPGVSTSALALALAWPLRSATDPRAAARVLVVEADGAGSSALPGYLCGQADPAAGLSAVLSAAPGDLEAVLRESVVEVERQADRYLLPGLPSPHLMSAHQDRWSEVARRLRSMSEAGHRSDVLVDAGRVGSSAEPAAVLAESDVAVVVCRTDLPSVVGALHAITHCERELRFDDRAICCLLVGEQMPYSLAEVEATLEVPVVGVLAWDPTSAEVLSHGAEPGRGFGRGRLLRSAVPVARALTSWVASAPADGGDLGVEAYG